MLGFPTTRRKQAYYDGDIHGYGGTIGHTYKRRAQQRMKGRKRSY